MLTSERMTLRRVAAPQHCRMAISPRGPAAPNQFRFNFDICEVNFGGCWPPRKGDATLGGRPAAGGGAPSTRQAPVLHLRGRCRGTQSRLHQNRGDHLEGAQQALARPLVRPYKGTDCGAGYLGKYPTSTRSATRPPIEGSRFGCRVLGYLYAFKKKKTRFFFIMRHKYPRKYPPEMVIFR